MATVLVCGGLGYIGSHIVLALLQAPSLSEYHVAVADNESNSSRKILKALPLSDQQWVRLSFFAGDLRKKRFAEYVLLLTQPAVVINLCAYIDVEESVSRPLKYYKNNVGSAMTLLAAMRAHGVCNYIFASTAAVYGPKLSPIDEDDILAPANPYGSSKQTCEALAGWLVSTPSSYMRAVTFRFFNVAGTEIPEGFQHQKHPVTHLISKVLLPQHGAVPVIYGADYETRDGTCVRDYVHVADIADAHVKAVEYLMEGGPSVTLNLGSGQGYTVAEVVQRCRELVPGIAAPQVAARRIGDSSVLVASNARAAQVLGWHPERGLDQMILSTAEAFALNSTHPSPY